MRVTRFISVLSEFRKRMKIHERVVSAATEIVNKTREAYNCTDVSFCVLVVVHMRIEDYTGEHIPPSLSIQFLG